MESVRNTGIGLVAIGPRDIKPGDEYAHLLPRADYRDSRVVANGSIDQIVREMGKVIRKYRKETQKLAPVLRGENIESTCRNIWEFVYHHIQYRKDKAGEEQLRTPSRLWAERAMGGDCDCGTIFISTLLLNLGIEPVIRIAGYDGRDYQHVYPIVPLPGSNQYYVIDFVVGEFNYEKPFTKNRDYSMSELGIPIHVLSGLDDVVLPTAATQNEKDVFDYLLNYRKYLIENPAMADLSTKNPVAFLRMLDYAIENFWKGQLVRDKAFDVLAKEEQRLQLYYTHLSGLGDAGLSGFWDKVKQAGKALSSTAKDIATGVNKVNPVAVAAKAAFRQLVLMNYQGLATRLAFGRVSLFDTKNYPKDRLRPALREIYSDSEIDEYFKYVDRVNNALEIYRNTFGGTGNEWDMLKSTIKKAALHNAVGFPDRVEEARQLSKHLEKIFALYKKHFNRDFLGEVDLALGEPATASAATVTAATPVLAAIAAALGGSIANALIQKATDGKVNANDIQNARNLYSDWKSGAISDADYQKAISNATNKAINAANSAVDKAIKTTIPAQGQAGEPNSEFQFKNSSGSGFLDSLKNMALANPLPAALIALGIGYFALPIFKR